MAIYNISKIENWYDDFISCKNNYINSYYDDYINCYIKKCSDSSTNKMESVLDKHYSRIKRAYNNINKFWKEYLNDLKNTDNRLAGSKAAINAATVSSKLSKLPVLKEYKAELKVKLSSVSAVVGTVKGIGWLEKENLDEKLVDIAERCGATISTFGVSLIEGMQKVDEDVQDLIVLTCAIPVTEYTYVLDLVSSLVAKQKGDESLKTNYTGQFWEFVRGFVSTNFTKRRFDSFYDNTSVGQWMKEKSYLFDAVRDVGNEVGKVIITEALAVVTGGGSENIFGVLKFVEHTEENWQDKDTSTIGGLLKGGVQGLIERMVYGAGLRGNNIMKTAASKVVEKGAKGVLKKGLILAGKEIYECGCAVAQDLSNILVDTVFSKNTIKDENGNVIKFDSFKDKFDYYYNKAGGDEGLLISMATGTVLSVFSDFIDIKKIGKNIDINTSSIKNSTSKAKDYIGEKLNTLKKEYQELLNYKKFKTNNSIKKAYKSFQIDNDKGLKILRKKDILSLIPLGTTNIDGRTIYMTSYNGKTIYSNTDIISQFLSGDETLKKSIIGNFLDESRINKYLMTTDGYIGYFEIENGVMQKKILKNFELKINEKANSYSTYLDAIRKFNNKSDFGADQHPAYNYIAKIDSNGVHVYDINRQSLINTINSLRSKYNIDANSVCNIIYNMDGDGAGACSYASMANSIFSKYRGKETEFMRDFGYPMYENINGQVALNSRTLVTDLYIFSNLDRNIPGKTSLFKTGNNGKIEVNPEFSKGKFRYDNQVYMSNSLEINDDDMNLFFRKNGLSVTQKSRMISLNSIKSELLKGNQVELGIYQNVNAPIILHNLDGGRDTITTSWGEGDGHALQVVGIQGDNIIVSSWGSKYSININDLKYGNYVVHSTSIKR